MEESPLPAAVEFTARLLENASKEGTNMKLKFMLMSAKALLLKNPHPTEEEIRRALSGNLCRCTGYEAIVEAVSAAAEQEIQ